MNAQNNTDQPTAPTHPPAPLAGGTTAALTQAAGHWCNLCGRGPMYSWEHIEDICKVCVPAEAAAGCKEGRTVSPATGEREAELREVLHGVVTIFCASASSYLNGYSRDEAVDELMSALTPLLDRREVELSQPWRLSSVCREKEAEIARLTEQEAEEQHKTSYALGYKDGWRDGRLPLNNPTIQ